MHRLSSDRLHKLFELGKIGTWEWNIADGCIKFSDEYLRLLDYTQGEIEDSVEGWRRLLHPHDFPFIREQLVYSLSNNISVYKAELRLVCKNSSIVWTRLLCAIERDESGKPTFVTGITSVIDISKKPSEFLGCIGEMSKILLSDQTNCDFHELVNQCLKSLGEIMGKSRISVWENFFEENEPYCKELYEWNSGGDSVARIPELEKLPYALLPTLKKPFDQEKTINTFVSVLPPSERNILERRGIKTILLAPIRLQGKNWGFICIDNCENFELFDLSEESVAIMAGFIIADAIEKHRTKVNFEESEKKALMLSGMPLAYTWWTHDIECIACNTAAVSLFDLSSEQEFLERFYELSPEYQPNGRLSLELIDEKIRQTFETGYQRFEWMHQKINGDLIPAEVILVRLKFKDDYIVESYVRDLREAKEAEDRNRLIVNAMPLCSNWWTRDKTNIACNDEAVRLFGLSSHQEYLDRFNELSPEYQPSGQLSSEMAGEKIEEAFEKGYCRFEWMHQKLDGEPIPAEIVLVRVKYKDDYIVVGSTLDLRRSKTMLAEMSKIESDLRLAHEEAVMSSKAKSNFLANMSHEIRTPLNAISGLTEIILRESPNQFVEENASGIKNACSSLINIINDILDISKVESGKLEIVNVKYELARLINDIINIVCIRLKNKPLIFTVNIDSKLPSKLEGDESRIKQILINLLANAIKFTDKGYIHLVVDGTFDGCKGNLVFSVKDTGFGIKQENFEQLFTEFERIDTRKNRNIEGTGLGLAISRRLAEMMDGKIEVESTFGKGSTFSLTIPQTCFPSATLATVKKKKKILLYEPRSFCATSIKETIYNLGCDCRVFSRQSELYNSILHEEFDYAFASPSNVSRVKQFLLDKKSAAKIVVFSTFSNRFIKTDMLTLPVPVTCMALAELLNNGSDTRQYYSNEVIPINFIAPEAKILIVDDNIVNLKVAEGLMKPFQFQIDTAVDGLEAVGKVKNNEYDIVFMDHMMPEMDGIDATIAIRNMEGDYYKKLPIIALTANAVTGQKEIFIEAGMSDFLAKPIEISMLNSTIARWIPSNKKGELKSLTKAVVEEEYDAYIEGVDVAVGIASIGGNFENYVQILSVYYTEGMKKASQLLEMFTAGDIPSFRVEVHALKSTSATIGAASVSSKARKLEDAITNNNLSYLDEHVAPFVVELRELLSNIGIYLEMHMKSKNCDQSSDTGDTGDMEYLQEYLGKLYEAIELVNIVKIETLLEDIFTYHWSTETTIELQKIQNEIACFDYDKALTCVKSLQEKVMLVR